MWKALLEASSEILPDAPLAQFIYYLVSDSASACVSARAKLQLELRVLAIPCLAHLFSLLPKHLVSERSGVACISVYLGLFSNITKVFRSWAEPKAMLQRIGNVTLQRLIETRFRVLYVFHCHAHRVRFFYVFTAIQAFTKNHCLQHLQTIFDRDEWVKFVESRSEADKNIIRSVVDAVYDPEFALFLNFFQELMTPWVRAMREFDRARGSIGIVYAIFSELTALATKTFESARFSTFPSAEVKQEIAIVIEKFVEKFSLPVFSAAFAVNPCFHSEVSQMAAERTKEFDSIRMDLTEVLGAFYVLFNQVQVIVNRKIN